MATLGGHSPTRRSLGSFATLVALAALFSNSASGQSPPPSPVELTWAAPEGCPARPYVLERIQKLLGTTPLAETRLKADGRVSLPEAGLWRVHLAVVGHGTDGERELTADTCERLADATALVLALAVDPEALARRPVASTKSSPPSEESGTTIGLALRPLLAGDLGTLPFPGTGIGAAVALLIGRARVELSGAYWFLQRVERVVGEGVGGSFQLVSGGLRGCFSPKQGTLELGACAGFEAGPLLGAGIGLADSGRGQSLWAAILGGAGAGLHLSHVWSLRADAGVGYAPLRPRFVAEGLGTIQESSPMVGRAQLGVEARFR